METHEHVQNIFLHTHKNVTPSVGPTCTECVAQLAKLTVVRTWIVTGLFTTFALRGSGLLC